MFLERTPEVAQLTLEELRERSRGPKAHHLLNKMYRFGANLTGSDQYWYKKRGELEAIFNQEGAATVFFTFSAADNHWADLHRHLSSGPNATTLEKAAAVCKYPHVTDRYFCKRLDAFLERFFDKGLSIKWRWHRIEYQS